MTSKLIDKLTKFCFHSASPTTPASHTYNPSKPNPQSQQAKPTTPLGLTPNPSPNGEGRDYRNKPVIRNNKTKCYRLYRQILSALPPNSVYTLHPVFICHYVILSLKKHSVITRPYVTLSLKNTLSLYVFMSFCL